MKPIACTAVILTATSTLQGDASANAYQVAVAIPFNFLLGDQILPSGNYLITADRKNPENMSIRNWEKNLSLQRRGWAMPWYAKERDVLVFHKYRSLHFLTDLHFAGSPVNIHFPTTKAEMWISAQPRRPRPLQNNGGMMALNS
jgi:hypothetical protein